MEDPAGKETFGTPGIAGGPPPVSIQNFWPRVWWDITHPFGTIGGAAAEAGAYAGGAPSKEARKASDIAASKPFEAPREAAKAMVGIPSPQAWAQSFQGWGIWILLAILLVVAVWGLVSSGGRNR